MEWDLKGVDWRAIGATSSFGAHLFSPSSSSSWDWDMDVDGEDEEENVSDSEDCSVRHQRHSSQHTLDLSDDLVIDGFRELAAYSWLEGTEVAVLAECVKESHLLLEYFVEGNSDL